ncbi:MAG TPA: energy transducer TonB [Xanthobacteraceae bacterium]|nr:energy transducer TonB [Xanthobacteraceae bacterium]
MIALAPEDLADLRRWAVCAAVVVLAHGGIAAGMVTWHEDDGGAEPAAAIVIEMAPAPVMSRTPKDIPPGPLQNASEASPNKPVETLEDKEKVEAKLKQKVEEKIETKPPEEPPPEAAPAPNPDVAVELPAPQEVKQEMAMRQSPSEASTASAPLVVADRTAEVAAAPTQGQVNPDDAKAVVVWQNQIFAALKKHLRYPARAERRGQAGTAQVILTIDRQGRLLDSRIIRGSGNAELDEEALAVLKRAEPSFTLPPPAVRGDRLDLNVAVNFLQPGGSVAKR